VKAPECTAQFRGNSPLSRIVVLFYAGGEEHIRESLASLRLMFDFMAFPGHLLFAQSVSIVTRPLSIDRALHEAGVVAH
jgi:hypothetical protein